MKRILILLILLILLVSPSAFAGVCMMGGSGAITEGVSCADSSCTGFEICQNFETETTGYDNSESWTESCGTGATCTEAYTTDPLRGTQSYYFSAGTAASTAYKAITQGSEYYGMVKVNIGSDASQYLFGLYSNATAKIVVGYNNANRLTVTYGGLAGCGASGTFNPETTYYIWFYYKSATTGNSDGIYRVWVSATATKPETVTCESTTQTTVATVNRFYLNSSISAGVQKYDQILLKTTEIGGVCE
jgi:hypothetical protein